MKIYGVQHIGFTVPDMDKAVAFFEAFFGAVICLSTGKLDVDDTFMAHRLGVPGDRRIEDIKVLRVGNGANLELFQYSGEPLMDEPLKRNSQSGGYHIAFQVDDCDAAAERLRVAGIEVLDGPNYVDSGVMAGLTWCYFKAPWGQFLEIVSMDGSLGAERAGGHPQWSPVVGA
ncbi:MAG: VOC family protein [Cypionkella sp.]|uniref:VOC family protein n=1 Tax=Cypionkella sp. TaxID=2811411 RepID=UPI002ABB3DD6|nr:VOC family protein [Cypionkella sp.]MDZ4310080.1 VOC family protein [Cypionkella sp.]MDZ4392672.1 VOC family protein [Cypionkella sp.]